MIRPWLLLATAALTLSACHSVSAPPRPAAPTVSGGEVSTVLSAARTSDDPELLHVHLAERLPESSGPLPYVAELSDADGRRVAVVPLERARRGAAVRSGGPLGTWAVVRVPAEANVRGVRIARPDGEVAREAAHLTLHPSAR